MSAARPGSGRPAGARPLRVAILGSRGYPSTYGGFETLVRRLAPWLRDDGMDVSVYCRDAGAPLGDRLVDGITCIYRRGFESKSASTLTYGFTAARDARKRGYDAMLVLNVANGFFLRGLRNSGIPVAVNVDGMEWERAKWNALGRAVFRAGANRSARHAGRIVVDSRVIGDLWRERFDVPSTFIPYGGDVVTDAGALKVVELGIEPGGYVLAVARLVPENNVDLLLDAMERLGWAWPLVVAGSAGYASPLEARLTELSERRDDVHWLGHVHDQELLTQLWASSAVYWHGHSVGGTNPALLQALGAGAPTVALDTPFNREVLGDAGCTVPADAVVLAACISELMADPTARRELADTGRRIVGERYRWDDVCDAYAELLRALASGEVGAGSR